MSVYIDEMQPCIQNKNWPYAQSCHLVADTVEELHTFALRMGLHRSWFQSGSIPHYDLTMGMRRRAVKLDAEEISRKKFSKLMRKYRKEKDNGRKTNQTHNSRIRGKDRYT